MRLGASPGRLWVRDTPLVSDSLQCCISYSVCMRVCVCVLDGARDLSHAEGVRPSAGMNDSEARLHGCALIPKDLWAMSSQTFEHLKQAHLLVILKRCITVVGGKRAVYWRLPSENPDAPIHMFTEAGVAAD